MGHFTDEVFYMNIHCDECEELIHVQSEGHDGALTVRAATSKEWGPSAECRCGRVTIFEDKDGWDWWKEER